MVYSLFFFFLTGSVFKGKAEQVNAHSQACDLDLSRANYMGRQRTVYLHGVNRSENCVLTRGEQT